MFTALKMRPCWDTICHPDTISYQDDKSWSEAYTIWISIKLWSEAYTIWMTNRDVKPIRFVTKESVTNRVAIVPFSFFFFSSFFLFCRSWTSVRVMCACVYSDGLGVGVPWTQKLRFPLMRFQRCENLWLGGVKHGTYRIDQLLVVVFLLLLVVVVVFVVVVVLPDVFH